MAILAGAKVDAADLAALGGAWTAYTPTLTNVTGGVAAAAFALVGKTLFLRGAFTAGTVTAAGIVTVSLPAGVTIGVTQNITAIFGRTGRSCVVNSTGSVIEISPIDGSNFAAAQALVAQRWGGVVEVA